MRVLHPTLTRNILDKDPLTARLSFDLVDWWDSGKYLDPALKDPSAPRFDHKVIEEGGKFNFMAMFRRSIAMFSSSRVVVTDRKYSQASLSLVELLHYCALIGRELHSNATYASSLMP